jgi:hypothetical protein
VEARAYRRALAAAVEEYRALRGERSRVDARLAQLEQTIGSLRRLCGLSPSLQSGLTDSVRAVLQAEGGGLTALEVRDRLVTMGFDLGRYASGLAVVHTVLKRLAESGRARVREAPGGRPTYQWRESPRAIAITEAELRALADPGVRPLLPGRRGPR